MKVVLQLAWFKTDMAAPRVMRPVSVSPHGTDIIHRYAIQCLPQNIVFH